MYEDQVVSYFSHIPAFWDPKFPKFENKVSFSIFRYKFARKYTFLKKCYENVFRMVTKWGKISAYPSQGMLQTKFADFFELRQKNGMFLFIFYIFIV